MPWLPVHPTLAHYVPDVSWVLDVSADPTGVDVVLDLVLSQDHPRRRGPRPGDAVETHRVTLSFRGVRHLEWTYRSGIPAVGPDGETDWGSLEELSRDEDTFVIAADFGRIVVTASDLDVQIVAE